MTVSLVCQTFVDPPQENKEITRDNLTCRITYCSSSKFKEYLFIFRKNMCGNLLIIH